MRLIDDNNLELHKYNSYSEAIKNAPTIDAVQVVRCKDCKYHYMTNCYNPKWEDTGVPGTEPFDFCSYGERK